MKPLIMGHRGCKGIEPENTLLGIKKAMSLGVDAVEVDVHLSKDKELVVIHDEKVKTKNKDYVKHMSLGQLKKLDMGKGEKIPTLQEVINVVKNKTLLVIEIKTNGAEKKVVELIKKNKLKKVIVISFIHKVIKKIKKLDKKIMTGALFKYALISPVTIAKNAKSDFVFPRYDIVDKKFVDECHKEGIKVGVWNIDNLKELEEYLKYGLDIIGTNRPDIIVPYIAVK